MANRSYRRPALLVSGAEETIAVLPGERYRSQMTLAAEDGSRLTCYVMTDNRRILLAKNEFSGVSCKVVYGIDAEGLKSGDRIDGTIVIISNLEEKKLPVHVLVGSTDAEAPARDLAEFTKLAEERTREAFRFFYQPPFRDILRGEDAAYRPLWEGLSAKPTVYQHMEEFLVAARQKEPVRFSLDRELIRAYMGQTDEQMVLNIRRSTWGCAAVSVETEGDFIRVSRKRIIDEDFVGRTCALEFVIDRGMVGDRIRHGSIILRSLSQTLACRIVAFGKDEIEDEEKSRRALTRYRLSRALLEHLLSEDDGRGWLAGPVRLINEMRAAEPASAEWLLIGACAAWKMGDNTRALEWLWPIKEKKVRLTNVREHAAYLALAGELDLLPEEERNILPKLREWSSQYPDDYLLLYLCRTQLAGAESAEVQLRHLEACYDAGCRSPFLYQDACRIFRSDESLLRRLTPFAIQALAFAGRRGAMTDALLMRTAFLSHNLKRFSGMVYHLLKKGYEDSPKDELLEAICRLAILGNAADPKYFYWYDLAIQHDLRITHLFEYYIETIRPDSSRLLPMPVLLYFSENEIPGERRKAFVYACVMRHRLDIGSLYHRYEKRIRDFAGHALEKGKIDADYAYLYERFFREPRDGRTATLVTNVLFTCELTCADPRVQTVIVCEEGMKGERAYPLTDGRAYIRIYGTKACILFEDSRRRRFQTDVHYELRRLMDVAETAPHCLEQHVRHAGLLLYACGAGADRKKPEPANLISFRLAETEEELTEEYRQSIRRSLLEYYLENPDDHSRIEYAAHMDELTAARADKKAAMRLLIEEGLFDQAFRVVSEYGYEGIPGAQLLQLAGRMILQKDLAYDEELLYLSAELFRIEKYNDTVLSYLRNWYEGPMEMLCRLWARLSGFQLETFPLEEKILKQSVFTGVFPDDAGKILASYRKEHGSRIVVTAFLNQAARADLLADRKTEIEIYEGMEALYWQDQELPDSMKISLLRHYSGMRQLDHHQMLAAENFLKDLDEKGIRFGFFRNLPAALVEKYQILDKVFIEERREAGSTVRIRYRVGHEEDEAGDWIEDALPEIFDGCFVKELLLFYGETVWYQIRVRDGKEWKDSDVRRITVDRTVQNGDTRYHLLNRMLQAEQAGDAAGLERAMRSYLRQKTYAETVFHLM